jgi:hypothetical protein
LGQLSLEQKYESTYHVQMTLLLADLRVYQATLQSPGACDKGSSRLACYQADVRTVADLEQFIKAIQTLNVPSRFLTANRDLNGALLLLEDGINMRDEVLQAGVSGTSLDPAIAKLQQGATLLRQAYSEFPQDARLDPPVA